MTAQRQDKRRGAEDEIKKVLKNKRCQKITAKQGYTRGSQNFGMSQKNETIFDISKCTNMQNVLLPSADEKKKDEQNFLVVRFTKSSNEMP